MVSFFLVCGGLVFFSLFPFFFPFFFLFLWVFVWGLAQSFFVAGVKCPFKEMHKVVGLPRWARLHSSREPIVYLRFRAADRRAFFLSVILTCHGKALVIRRQTEGHAF